MARTLLFYSHCVYITHCRASSLCQSPVNANHRTTNRGRLSAPLNQWMVHHENHGSQSMDHNQRIRASRDGCGMTHSATVQHRSTQINTDRHRSPLVATQPPDGRHEKHWSVKLTSPHCFSLSHFRRADRGRFLSRSC